MTAATAPPVAVRPSTPAKASRRKRRRLPWAAVTIIGVFALAGLFAPMLAPYDPYGTELAQRLQSPSWEHLLGTDTLGRDVLSRLIYGARVTWVVVLISLAVSAAVGITLGVVAGYFRGRVDTVISRSVDATLAIPSIFIALALAVSWGPGARSVIVAVIIILWARFTRVVRSDVLALRENDFIAQAAVTGCSHTRTMLVHLLPNVANSIMVLLSINMGYVIMLEATLSFLGAGIPPPAPSWGGMVSEGQNYVSSAWWLSIVPGLAIGLVVLALNMIGDWFRDYLDPTLRDAL
jgi:peptide/nickel transport system permease protein